MSEISEKQLAEWKMVTSKATPGPWSVEDREITWNLYGQSGLPHLYKIAKCPKKSVEYAEYWPNEYDSAFMVAARTAMPQLIEALEVAKQHINELTQRIEKMENELSQSELLFTDIGEAIGADDSIDPEMLPGIVHRMGQNEIELRAENASIRKELGLFSDRNGQALRERAEKAEAEAARLREIVDNPCADWHERAVNAEYLALDRAKEILRLREVLHHIGFQKPVSRVDLNWQEEWQNLRGEARKALQFQSL